MNGIKSLKAIATLLFCTSIFMSSLFAPTQNLIAQTPIQPNGSQQLNKELLQLKQQIAELSRQIETDKQKDQGREDEIKKLKAKEIKLEQKIKELTQEKNKFEREKATAESQLVTINTEIAKQQIEIKSLKEKAKKENEEDVIQKNKEQKQIKVRQQLEASLTKAVNEKNTLLRNIAKFKEQLRQNEVKLKNAEDTARIDKGSAEKAAQIFYELKAKHAKAQKVPSANESKFRAEIVRLQREIARLTSELETIKRRVPTRSTQPQRATIVPTTRQVLHATKIPPVQQRQVQYATTTQISRKPSSKYQQPQKATITTVQQKSREQKQPPELGATVAEKTAYFESRRSKKQIEASKKGRSFGSSKTPSQYDKAPNLRKAIPSRAKYE